MLEMLRSIPDPQFLIFFPLLTTAGIVIARLIINRGQSRVRLPEPSSFSPVSVAALRGGSELVLKTIVYGMYHRGIIELVPDTYPDPEGSAGSSVNKRDVISKKSPDMVFRRTEGAARPVDKLELAIWNFLWTGQFPEVFFQNKILRSIVAEQLNQSLQELEEKGLVTNAEHQKFSWIVALTIIAIVEAIGWAKLYPGLTGNSTSIFLSIMMLLSLLIMLKTIHPGDRLTYMGRKFNKRLEAHFEWLKGAVKAGSKPGIDPAFAFAIFGTGVLVGTALCAPASEAFAALAIGSGVAGGCGGSSGDGGSINNSDSSFDSSSDGGSSDSGGGSGCGGCSGGGGCGGGGGD